MMIEWEKKADDLHTGKAGKLFEVVVASSDSEWLTTVMLVSRDGSDEVDYDQALRPTVEEAKQAAQTSVDYALRPFVETARAEGAAAEREACAQIARERAEMARLPSGWDAALAEALAIEAAIRARCAKGSEP